MRKLAFYNVSKQTLLGDSVGLAETSAERRQGLLKRDGLGQGEGLWIVPCGRFSYQARNAANHTH